MAPIAKERPSIGLLIKLGLIGACRRRRAWLGGFARAWPRSCVWPGAGAIAQVIHQLSNRAGLSLRRRSVASARVMPGSWGSR